MASDWQRTDPTESIKANYRTFVDKTFIMPNGESHVFTTIHPEDGMSCGVIALTPDHQVIIARQFRPGPERMMDEIPGGGVDPGEDPADAARRELKEETGYIPGGFELLGTSCRDGYSNATWYYYLATDCVMSEQGQQLDEHEYVDTVLISIQELLDNAKNDRMADPAAVLFAYDKLKSY